MSYLSDLPIVLPLPCCAALAPTKDEGVLRGVECCAIGAETGWYFGIETAATVVAAWPAKGLRSGVAAADIFVARRLLRLDCDSGDLVMIGRHCA